MTTTCRQNMVHHAHEKLSITRQCKLLSVSRSSFYYQAKPEKPINLTLMKEIDKAFLEYPFFGVEKMKAYLVNLGYTCGIKRTRRLMRLMDLIPIYQKPKTTITSKENPTYPYLLRNLDIKRANQVWCADITYIPMKRGFLYLVAVMDWHTRRVLSWRLSATMDTDFCVQALEEAIMKYGLPEIFNTDQGSQFTSSTFTTLLKTNKIKISMDGKGRYMDNIFIERFWRSLKYEEIFLHSYEDGKQAKSRINYWISFYNTVRPHSSLNGQTPDRYYKNSLPLAA